MYPNVLYPLMSNGSPQNPFFWGGGGLVIILANIPPPPPPPGYTINFSFEHCGFNSHSVHVASDRALCPQYYLTQV